MKKILKESPKKNRSKTPRFENSEMNQKLIKDSQIEVEEIRQMMRRYRKQIYLPINYCTTFYKNHAPQRCVIHNSIITLYCLDQKRLLCATCMYQGKAHQKHQVLPINKVQSQMREGFQHNIRMVSTKLHLFDTLAYRCKKNYEQTQNAFKDIAENINNFYSQTQRLFKDQKKAHFNNLHVIWKKLSYQYNTYGQSLDKIYTYVRQKLDELKTYKSNDNLLYSLNVSQKLMNVQKIVHQDLCKFHQIKEQGLQKYDKILSFLKKNLTFNIFVKLNDIIDVKYYKKVNQTSSQNLLEDKNLSPNFKSSQNFFSKQSSPKKGNSDADKSATLSKHSKTNEAIQKLIVKHNDQQAKQENAVQATSNQNSVKKTIENRKKSSTKSPIKKPFKTSVSPKSNSLIK